MSNLINVLVKPISKCPLCGSKSYASFDSGIDTLLPEINRYLPVEVGKFSQGYSNHRNKCIDCGLIYLSPRPTTESLSIIYSLWYGYAYKRVMVDPVHVGERRREFEQFHLKKLESSCPKRGRLLDVGCGSGIFLGLAKNRGWTVTGVEFDSLTAEWAKVNEGINDIRCGVLCATLKEGELFDAITLFDYLEHTENPGEDLNLLISHLAPGGVLMIRVPNSSGWQANFMKARWISIMPTHLSYFSKRVLRATLVQRGLEVTHLTAGNYRSQADIIRQQFNWVRKRLQTSQSPSIQSEVIVSEGFNGGILKSIQRWLSSIIIEQVDHVGGWFGKGNNLTAIARKVI
jgi:2-polyprenyl-3-methyl-5-hydroxy-6-metoxy-1,4-benzoquinol methylase